VDTIIPKLERVSRSLAQKIRPFVDEVAQMLEKLELFGIPARQSIIFHPLALVFNSRITDGVCFEVVRPGKRADVLAAGGRYAR
jgi:translation initiation factor 2-alpha kinase 4